MREELQQALVREADKQIRRHFANLETKAKHRHNYAKRTGKVALRPGRSVTRHWGLDQQFDPFYVRKHSGSIAHALEASIRRGDYKPRPSLRIEIPKPNGGTRAISIFTVVDAAVSYWLFQRLLDRNTPVFSGYSYAYRSDRNAQHAIEHLFRAMKGRQSIYVLEYDFTRYFDSVNHKYLLNVIAEVEGTLSNNSTTTALDSVWLDFEVYSGTSIVGNTTAAIASIPAEGRWFLTASLVLVYNERYIMTNVQPARISFNTSDSQHISSRLEFDPVCRSWKSREPCK